MTAALALVLAVVAGFGVALVDGGAGAAAGAAGSGLLGAGAGDAHAKATKDTRPGPTAFSVVFIEPCLADVRDPLKQMSAAAGVSEENGHSADRKPASVRGLRLKPFSL